jgi:hypothetical protein
MKKAQAKKAKPTLKQAGLKAVRILTRTNLPELAFISSLIFGKYLTNADFQYPGETIIPIVIFAVITAFIFYFFRLVLKNMFAIHAASLGLSYALYSFNYLPGRIKDLGKILLPKHFETTFSDATVTVLIITAAAGLLGFACGQVVRRSKIVRELQPYRIMLLVLLLIFTLQSYKVVHNLAVIRRQLTYHYPEPAYQKQAGTSTQKPDIYYLVFDRYGSAPMLKEHYDFDNSGLMDSLSGLGFVNRLDAKANYPFTMESITSTMAMSYHTELEKLFGKAKIQTAFPYRDIFSNPPIAQLLKQNGYDYNLVSSWWDFTRVGIKADSMPSASFRLRILGMTSYMSDLSRDVINKSILSQWLKKGVSVRGRAIIKYDLDNSPRDNFFAQAAAIKQLAGSKHDKPQFTFAHILAPHDPYIFDADGTASSYDGGRNDNGVDETEKYRRGLTYLNTQIKDTMAYIREKSPNAAIIIQADEGPYPKQFRHKLTPDHYYDPVDLSLDQMQQKYGIIASYYMPGVDTETVAKNITASVNPFRFILE